MQTDIKVNVNTDMSRSASSVKAKGIDAGQQGQEIAGGSQTPGKSVPPAEQAAEATTVGKEDLREAVERLSDYVQNVQRNLHFSVDESSGRTIITVIDSGTKEVIRQIPPKEVLSLSERLESGDLSLVELKA